MGLRLKAAQAASAALTWGLRNIAKRPAANTPGLAALKIDPNIIAELRSRMHKGSIVVVGTNGKTTVTNIMADILEQSGQSVLCNRTGANLKSGIASVLLQSKGADWGVIECDELWLARVLPELQAQYVLLLDLFRDQLDRCGEIDHIQDAIVSGLEGSPDTALIYNADDPLCAMVAERVDDGRRLIAFGTVESMGLEQNRVADAAMCQRCSHMFEYAYRQYGQLGAYSCPSCGFARPKLDFEAIDIRLDASSLSFCVRERGAQNSLEFPLSTALNGTYMVYNLLAVSAAAITSGCTPENIQEAVSAFNPKNGRLQEYCIDGRRTLLNLAKNPTGFNQNLRIVAADGNPRAVAFFINDKVVDGHDISWIWDIDFEELVRQENVVVFVGGTRKNDLQVRLKYAGVDAQLVDGIEDVFAAIRSMPELPPDAGVYAIANYTALPPVHSALDAMQDAATCKADDGNSECSVNPSEKLQSHAGHRSEDASAAPAAREAEDGQAGSPIVIAHILPDLLNLYGDGGNVRILEQRLKWRGIPVEVRRFNYDTPISFDDADLVVLGGSPDREQRLALERMQDVRDGLNAYVQADGPLLAICGGYQMLGRTWVLGGEEVEGLDVLPIETRREGASTDRLIDNIALDTKLSHEPVIGYENHSGRTYLDDGVEAFGRVVSHVGFGNNDTDQNRADGAIYRNAVGTYLHGPLLSKNPDIADHLLSKAVEYHAKRTGEKPFMLAPLDDSVEHAANAYMQKRLC